MRSATTATRRRSRTTTSRNAPSPTLLGALAFFAQDHASSEMVYANADVTKREAAREILAFADHWKHATGDNPGLLVFDSKLTTYTVLEELSARGIDWLTLRQRVERENSTASPPCLLRRGRTCASTGPAATATPSCTRTSS